MQELIEDDPKAPNIAFGSIGYIFEDFNRLVERSAHIALVFHVFMDIYFGKPKVTDFKHIFDDQ